MGSFEYSIIASCRCCGYRDERPSCVPADRYAERNDDPRGHQRMLPLEVVGVGYRDERPSCVPADRYTERHDDPKGHCRTERLAFWGGPGGGRLQGGVCYCQVGGCPAGGLYHPSPLLGIPLLLQQLLHCRPRSTCDRVASTAVKHDWPN